MTRISWGIGALPCSARASWGGFYGKLKQRCSASEPYTWAVHCGNHICTECRGDKYPCEQRFLSTCRPFCLSCETDVNGGKGIDWMTWGACLQLSGVDNSSWMRCHELASSGNTISMGEILWRPWMSCHGCTWEHWPIGETYLRGVNFGYAGGHDQPCHIYGSRGKYSIPLQLSSRTCSRQEVSEVVDWIEQGWMSIN